MKINSICEINKIEIHQINGAISKAVAECVDMVQNNTISVSDLGSCIERKGVKVPKMEVITDFAEITKVLAKLFTPKLFKN